MAASSFYWHKENFDANQHSYQRPISPDVPVCDVIRGKDLDTASQMQNQKKKMYIISQLGQLLKSIFVTIVAYITSIKLFNRIRLAGETKL